MKIAHARLVFWLALMWVGIVAALWPAAVRAGTLSADIKLYDWLSLTYAGAFGILGGVLALIVALATDSRVVPDVLREGLRNIIVSPIGGAAAFLIIESATSMTGFNLSPVGRFIVIGGSGWAGVAFFVWARDTATRIAFSFANWVVKQGPKP